MGRRILGFLCFVAAGVTGHVALAQDFSADVVQLKQGSDAFKKIYSTKDKVRYEFQGQKQAMGPAVVIADQSQNKWTLLLTERHMYMDSWPPMMHRPTIMQYWHVQDVDDACPQWKKLADQTPDISKNWGSCTKIGSDTVNGRSTVKYEGVSAKGEKSNIWVDKKLRCVIKMDSTTGGNIELTNIQEGSQPASLFEIPAGYTKFDFASMMGQMGQQR